MTKLECSVCTCKYNEDHCCCKHEIMVGKTGSTTSKETECASFVCAKESPSNSTKEPNVELSIICEAEKCVYNDNKRCRAKQVDINGSSAHMPYETACSTFKLR